jgi:hypothetical protein
LNFSLLRLSNGTSRLPILNIMTSSYPSWTAWPSVTQK